MKFSYSTYTSDANEVLRSPISYQELMSDHGYVYGLEVQVQIQGQIIRDSNANLITRLNELRSIVPIRGGNFGYTGNDNSSTGLSINSSDTLGGLGISNFQLSQEGAGEMGLFAHYSLTISGIIAVGAAIGGNPIVEFAQSFRMINPWTNGDFVTVPIQGDRPQRHDTYAFLPGQYIQTGRVVFLKEPPANVLGYLPPPISPGDVHWPQAEINRGEPRKVQNGYGLFWPVEYSYPMESTVPIGEAALRPTITY